MLKLEGFAVPQGLPHDTVNAGAIGRMYSLQERLVRGAKLSRFQAIDTVQLVRPHHLIG